MKTILRTFLLLFAFSFTTLAYAQTAAEATSAPKSTKKKAVAKNMKAEKASTNVSATPVAAEKAPAAATATPVATEKSPAAIQVNHVDDGTNVNAIADPNEQVVDPATLTTMKVDQDTYDFGKIVQGDIVKHKFVVTNTGKQPLILENVKPSCGCTAIDWPRDPIAPGASASIEAQFNSTGKMGHQQKNITITYNGAERIAYLTFTGDIVPKEGEAAPEHDHQH